MILNRRTSWCPRSIHQLSVAAWLGKGVISAERYNSVQPMPVDPENYSHRGGGNYGIVVVCPTLIADRLVYFDHNRERGSWVVRDFITGRRLDNEHSPLTVAQIEDDAAYNEYPPWCNVENEPGGWTTYLRLRTTAAFRNGVGRSLDAPNPQSGQWQPL